jgi:hypothetical protein
MSKGGEWKSKIICKDEVSVSTLTVQEAEKMIADNKCAEYYLHSTPGMSVAL